MYAVCSCLCTMEDMPDFVPDLKGGRLMHEDRRNVQ